MGVPASFVRRSVAALVGRAREKVKSLLFFYSAHFFLSYLLPTPPTSLLFVCFFCLFNLSNLALGTKGCSLFFPLLLRNELDVIWGLLRSIPFV